MGREGRINIGGGGGIRRPRPQCLRLLGTANPARARPAKLYCKLPPLLAGAPAISTPTQIQAEARPSPEVTYMRSPRPHRAPRASLPTAPTRVEAGPALKVVAPTLPGMRCAAGDGVALTHCDIHPVFGQQGSAGEACMQHQ